MRIDSAFPSTYLKAADLQGKNVTVTMDNVKMEDIGGDHKPVLYFLGKEKGLVLNKTNSNNISAAYGWETDEWTGQVIELFPAMVDFQGKTVEAVRVRVPRGASRAATRHPHAPPQYGNGNGNGANTAPAHPVGMEPAARPVLDDEIPF